MNFSDVLKKRRAVRDYTQAPIEQKEIEALINAAVEAPSAMNLQPWAFAAVLGREQIDSYAKRAKDWLLENLAQLPDDQSHKLQERILENPDFTLFYHAPALVLVLARSSEAQAVQECCLAAQSFMLAARDRELGTCWIGFARPWLNLPEVKAELGIPAQYQAVAPIVLGHPVSWPESHGRKPAEIHWVHPVQAVRRSLVPAI
jgi:nitroreductase